MRLMHMWPVQQWLRFIKQNHALWVWQKQMHLCASVFCAYTHFQLWNTHRVSSGLNLFPASYRECAMSSMRWRALLKASYKLPGQFQASCFTSSTSIWGQLRKYCSVFFPYIAIARQKVRLYSDPIIWWSILPLFVPHQPAARKLNHSQLLENCNLMLCCSGQWPPPWDRT